MGFGLMFGAGSGWLEKLGFIDFAGSTMVHSVGAWVALAGAVVLGPRCGQYSREGKPLSIPGHSMSMAGFGVQVLGVVVAFVWSFGVGYVVFKLVAATVGLRLSEEEEMEGLDWSEHRAAAYSEFALVRGGLQGGAG